MIQRFKDEDTAELFQERKNRRWQNIKAVALRKLDIINAVPILTDLRVPPGNHLEALKGNRQGQHSIRINDRYRICFVWKDDGAHEVRNCGLSRRLKALGGASSMPLIKPATGWKFSAVTTHPGTVLLEEFLEPLGISQNKLAMDIHVPATRIGEIVHGDRAVTTDTALRLARYFETSAEFWLNLQSNYDLSKARIEKEEQIAQEVHAYAR
jgi:antitoxin HigA-1